MSKVHQSNFPCKEHDCDEPAITRQWCIRHYRNWLQRGDPCLDSQIRKTEEERFWEAVNQNGPIPEIRPELGPCWIWLRKPDKKGYGHISAMGQKGMAVHRYAYIKFIGPIPEGYVIDHLCHVRRCCNPKHLEAVTPSENTLRGLVPLTNRQRYAALLSCPKGHLYDEANTIWREHDGYMTRECRACGRVANRRSYEKRREAGGHEVRPYVPRADPATIRLAFVFG